MGESGREIEPLCEGVGTDKQKYDAAASACGQRLRFHDRCFDRPGQHVAPHLFDLASAVFQQVHTHMVSGCRVLVRALWNVPLIAALPVPSQCRSRHTGILHTHIAVTTRLRCLRTVMYLLILYHLFH